MGTSKSGRRYHPHRHGSSAYQTGTANGVIIVDGDAEWLPDSGGCAGVKALLGGAQEVVLHLALLAFRTPTVTTRTGGGRPAAAE